MISSIVLPRVVTDMLVITLDPDSVSPTNSISVSVPHPPPIVTLLLIMVSPKINVSPVTESTENTSFSEPPLQLLEITNVFTV